MAFAIIIHIHIMTIIIMVILVFLYTINPWHAVAAAVAAAAAAAAVAATAAAAVASFFHQGVNDAAVLLLQGRNSPQSTMRARWRQGRSRAETARNLSEPKRPTNFQSRTSPRTFKAETANGRLISKAMWCLSLDRPSIRGIDTDNHSRLLFRNNCGTAHGRSICWVGFSCSANTSGSARCSAAAALPGADEPSCFFLVPRTAPPAAVIAISFALATVSACLCLEAAAFARD